MKLRLNSSSYGLAACVALAHLACKGSKPDGESASSSASSVDAQASATAASWTDAAASTSPSADAARSLDDACEAYAAAWCGAMQKCSPYLVTRAAGDVDRCRLRKKVECNFELAPPASGATVSSIDLCAKAASSATCDRLVAGEIPACRPAVGTLRAGAACLVDAQCTSGFCDRDAAMTCGVCAAAPKLGEACMHQRCGVGQRCVVGAGLPAAAIDGPRCAAPLSLGEACGARDVCAGTLRCFDGRCVVGARVGDPCDASGRAAPDCDETSGGVCDPASKKCAAVILAREGEACSAAAGAKAVDAKLQCEGRLRCAHGTCVAPTPDWAKCDDKSTCDPPSRCIAGACKPPGLGQCAAAP